MAETELCWDRCLLIQASYDSIVQQIFIEYLLCALLCARHSINYLEIFTATLWCTYFGWLRLILLQDNCFAISQHFSLLIDLFVEYHSLSKMEINLESVQYCKKKDTLDTVCLRAADHLLLCCLRDRCSDASVLSFNGELSLQCSSFQKHWFSYWP